jgi:F-type H+-transporting ATPase subunit gamma
MTDGVAVFKYLEGKPTEGAGKQLLIACSSDRGLCGAIHSTVSKPVKAVCRTDSAAAVIVVGDKPKAQISRQARNNIVMSFNSIGKSIPTFKEASSIAELIMTSKVEATSVSIYYNYFKSVIAYELAIIKPLTKDMINASGIFSFCCVLISCCAEKMAQFEIEDDVVENFAEFTFANALYHAMVEGHASEMAARRTAMENATKNAGDMIDKLTIKYNRSRQASITNDLIDIITGASAL